MVCEIQIRFVLLLNHVLLQSTTVVMVLFKIVKQVNEHHLHEMQMKYVMVVQEASYMIVMYTMVVIISVVLQQMVSVHLLLISIRRAQMLLL